MTPEARILPQEGLGQQMGRVTLQPMVSRLDFRCRLNVSRRRGRSLKVRPYQTMHNSAACIIPGGCTEYITALMNCRAPPPEARTKSISEIGVSRSFKRRSGGSNQRRISFNQLCISCESDHLQKLQSTKTPVFLISSNELASYAVSQTYLFTF